MSKNMLAFNYLLAEKPINTEISRKLSKPLLKIYNSLDRNRIPNIMLYSDFSFSDILKYITWPLPVMYFLPTSAAGKSPTILLRKVVIY